jgi:hypothetical protein
MSAIKRSSRLELFPQLLEKRKSIPRSWHNPLVRSEGLMPLTHEGSDYAKLPPLRLCLHGDCGPWPDSSGACHAGIDSRFQQEPGKMSLVQAKAFAFSLATTLMVSIVIFRACDRTLTVVPADDYDVDASHIVYEIDPHAR